MILRNDATLWANGNNQYGQLGDGTTIDRHTPTQIMRDVQAVAAAGIHTIVLDENGNFWAMGWNVFGALGDGTTVNRNYPVPVELPWR